VAAVTITVKRKTQLAVPISVQRRAHIKAGDKLEFIVSGGVITIIPRLPLADDEYTPRERAIVDAQLAEGLEDLQKGRVSPPFETVEKMLASLKSGRKTARRTKPRA
jgi:bifunctional DNA-binding transcriptional regulator/antitoxin component of YhaV-PrlF toxin-antitoxin module